MAIDNLALDEAKQVKCLLSTLLFNNYMKFNVLLFEPQVHNIELSTREKIISEIPLKHVILDCSPFNFIDSMGANAILQV